MKRSLFIPPDEIYNDKILYQELDGLILTDLIDETQKVILPFEGRRFIGYTDYYIRFFGEKYIVAKREKNSALVSGYDMNKGQEIIW